MADYIENLSADEVDGTMPAGGGTGATLVQMWIAALAWNDPKTADYIAEKLDPYNRYAYELACGMGKARPDEGVLAKWRERFGDGINPTALMD